MTSKFLILNFEYTSNPGEAANSHKVHRTTFLQWIKNKQTIKKQYFALGKRIAEKRNRVREGDFPFIDAGLLAFFNHIRSSKITLTGPILQQKALEIKDEILKQLNQRSANVINVPGI